MSERLDDLTAPFPYFGGKSSVADIVWDALGGVKHYIEPFCGSCAVLLARPNFDPSGHLETVNDKNGNIANAWRAMQFSPDETARWCDWPVNHCCPSGTMIPTVDGETAIEEIMVGMRLLAEVNGRVVETTVTGITSSYAMELFSVGGLLVTGNHPFLTQRGYIRADNLDNDDFVLELYWPVSKIGDHGTGLGYLYAGRPANGESALRWRKLQCEKTILRTLVVRKERRDENAPAVLAPTIISRWPEPNLQCHRENHHDRLAVPRTFLDCPLSPLVRTYEPDGRGRWFPWVQDDSRATEGDVDSVESSLSSWSEKWYVGKTPYAGSKRENSESWPGSQINAASTTSSTGVKIGQDIIQRTHRKDSPRSFRKTFDRRAQGEDCGRYGWTQASLLHRDGDHLSVRDRRQQSHERNGDVNQSSNSQALSVQRLSLDVPTKVFNIETGTGNYFANRLLVHNCDLSARKKEIIRNKDMLVENLTSDPKWHDPVLAGYWIWAASCWIGSGLESIGQRPHLSNGGSGVHRIGKRPHLSSGTGVHRIGQRPHLTSGGSGVHRIGQIPHLSSGGKGVQEPYNENIYRWFRILSERLRYVRVVCGDWKRVCGGDWQDNMGVCGVFCMAPNTLIRMADETFLPVSDCRVGMELHGGRRIKSVMSRLYNGTMLRLKIQGMPDDLIVTPEHRIMRVPKRPASTRQDVRTNEQRWRARELVQAAKIEIGDMVLVPLGGKEKNVEWVWTDQIYAKNARRQKPVRFTPTDGLWRLLGYYAAEGCIIWRYGRPGCVQFTFNRNERDTYVQDVMDLCTDNFGITPTVRLHNPGAVNLHIGSVPVAEFFSRYVPGNSLTKRLHQALMTAPVHAQEKLLVGWLRGDGGIWYSSRNRTRLTGTSSSEGLARDMMILAYRCGLRPSFKRRMNKIGFWTNDVYFASQDAGRLGWQIPGLKDRCSRRIVYGHILVHVTGISGEDYCGPVYDLDVDGDDLIVASNVLIHNCDPPYGVQDRDTGLYGEYDGVDIAAQVMDWIRERGKRDSYRIVLAGYEEHESLLSDGWTFASWSAGGGYGNQGNGQGKKNRHRERLYFSPHCLTTQQNLF